MNDKLTMTVQEIMDLGFSKWTAYNILRQAKHIMVERGSISITIKDFGTVPVSVVAEILGLEELHVKN